MLIKYQSIKKPKFGKLLRYIFRNHLEHGHIGTYGHVLTHNIKGKTLQEWEAEFIENEKYRQVSRINSIKARHIIMSFHPDDSSFITPEHLLDLARYFIQAYTPRAMYVSTIHFDTDHIHVHILASGIEYRSGRTIRHTKKEFQQVKQQVESYQIENYPKLVHSVVMHGKKGKEQMRVKDAEYRIKKRTRSPTQKEFLLEELTSSTQAVTSQNAFWENLKGKRIEPYVRGGKIIGVVYGKRKFRFKTLGIERQLREYLNQNKNRSTMGRVVFDGWER